ncbi:MAG TPA: aldehyde dehydrogenase family protein [Mycobacteriales bacterium]|nr:aldehyde dehydrogenase family protein [Mycobacteriales bacterium]
MSVTAEARADSATFNSLSPATGEVVATLPVDGPEQVAAAVVRAREAAGWWRELGFAGRRRRLRTFQGVLLRGRDELLDLIHRENGKPIVDAWIEHTLALEHIGWAARHAGKVLGRQRPGGSLMLANISARLEYQPLGVVGVIGPWNYPLFTPMGSIAYALAAGNTVVFKPSEYTPAVGRWLADAFADVVDQRPVFQVVTGFGETGAALCRSGVNKIAFTGSAPTGRKIMATCAETLTPVLLELGGNDAMIVDDDADVAAAARAALWGGCANAGQTCIGIERVYATAAVYDSLVDKVRELAGPLRAGAGSDAALGPITMPKQVELIEAHVRDALDRGARTVVGGLESIHAPYVEPIVLVDVPEDARLMQEETFGPVLPIIKVQDADEAVARANASPFGLGAAVFAKRRGVDIARRLQTGMVSVNSMQAFAGLPSLPFGGVGDSGFGRIHGADGLREFTRPKATAVQRFKLPAELLAFDRPAWLPRAVQRVDELRYGRRRPPG